MLQFWYGQLYYDMHKDEEKHSMYLEDSIYKHYNL